MRILHRSAVLIGLTAAVTFLGAASASATVRIDGASGNTLTVVGSNGDDDPWFDYYDYDTGTDYTRIFDSGEVQIGASAPECFHPDPDPAPIPQASEDVRVPGRWQRPSSRTRAGVPRWQRRPASSTSASPGRRRPG